MSSRNGLCLSCPLAQGAGGLVYSLLSFHPEHLWVGTLLLGGHVPLAPLLPTAAPHFFVGGISLSSLGPTENWGDAPELISISWPRAQAGLKVLRHPGATEEMPW